MRSGRCRSARSSEFAGSNCNSACNRRTTSQGRRRIESRSRYEELRMSVGEAVPTGNTFDKYGSTNPVVRRLMAGFEGTLDRLFERAAPQSVVDVGCGEGVLTFRWAQRLGDAPVLGLDLEDPKLRGEWET